VIRTVVAPTMHKKGLRATDAGPNTTAKIASHTVPVSPVSERLVEPVLRETQLICKLQEKFVF
jgi:vacuolar-type H+-ATPase catalytic subunit A/Vma1